MCRLYFFFSGEYYLGYKKFDLQGVSWYSLLHPECMKEVQSKHRQSECKLCIKLNLLCASQTKIEKGLCSQKGVKEN